MKLDTDCFQHSSRKICCSVVVVPLLSSRCQDWTRSALISVDEDKSINNGLLMFFIMNVKRFSLSNMRAKKRSSTTSSCRQLVQSGVMD